MVRQDLIWHTYGTFVNVLCTYLGFVTFVTVDLVFVISASVHLGLVTPKSIEQGLVTFERIEYGLVTFESIDLGLVTYAELLPKAQKRALVLSKVFMRGIDTGTKLFHGMAYQVLSKNLIDEQEYLGKNYAVIFLLTVDYIMSCAK